MPLSVVNGMISLQELQLIHMLAQSPARVRAEDSAASRRVRLAGGGQNLPSAVNLQGTHGLARAEASPTARGAANDDAIIGAASRVELL
jgi:hypothetical protein